MISCFKSFSAGSLIELASLHNIRLDTKVSDFSGSVSRYQRVNATLCASVCSVLRSTEQSAATGLRPLILDAVIGLGTKNALRRALRCPLNASAFHSVQKTTQTDRTRPGLCRLPALRLIHNHILIAP